MADFARIGRGLGYGLAVLTVILLALRLIITFVVIWFHDKQASCADIKAPDHAIEVCSGIIQTGGQPHDVASALANRALAYDEKNQYPLAITDCNRALELDPDNLAAFVNRGFAHMKLKQIDLAIGDFNEALRLNPHEPMALNDRGDAYIENHQYDLALKDLDEAIQNDPHAALALTNRAKIYLIKKLYTQALQDLDTAGRLEPDNKGIVMLRGIAENQMHHYDEALHDYTAMIDAKLNDPSATATLLALRADSYMDIDDFTAAKKDLDAALQLDPTNSAAFYFHSVIFSLEGDWGKGIADLDRAIEGNPEDDSLYCARGIAKYYGGATDDGVADFSKTISLGALDEDKILPIIWLHLAHIKSGQDDRQEFDHNSTQSMPDKWPLALLDLYRGTANIEDVVAKAKIGDPAALSDQACDKDFYLAQFYVQKGRKDAARRLFEAAKSDCHVDDIEYSAALMELKTIGN